VRLEPLYTLRFFYPDGWDVSLHGAQGVEESHFYFAEGKCEGRISGEFRGSNHPRRRADETFAMDLQGFIETTDGATIMLDYRGYGRSRKRSDDLYASAAVPPEAAKYRRQVVGFARHVTDSPKYVGLNDAVCAIVGEVRAPAPLPGSTSRQSDVKLIFEVSELIWEPVPE
jgi:Protein of unknown function (DUF3237)